MRPCFSALAFRLCVGLAALLVPAIGSGLSPTWQSSALAGATQDAEKQAFEEAKALGTVEAWDAFLSHYPSGFHADLARAYLKRLTDDAPAPSPAAPSVAATDDFPVAAGSWGGVLRDGPGQSYRQIGSLQEGEPVTLMSRSDVVENGFPWFKITTRGGKTGYQWGGILCSDRSRTAGRLQDLHGEAGKRRRGQEADQDGIKNEKAEQEAVPRGRVSQSERRLPA